MIGMVPPDLNQPQTAFPSYYQPEVRARVQCLPTQAGQDGSGISCKSEHEQRLARFASQQEGQFRSLCLAACPHMRPRLSAGRTK